MTMLTRPKRDKIARNKRFYSMNREDIQRRRKMTAEERAEKTKDKRVAAHQVTEDKKKEKEVNRHRAARRMHEEVNIYLNMVTHC